MVKLDPTVVWTSTSAALDRAFAGTFGDDDDVTVAGDLDVLVELFTALGQSSSAR